MNDYQFMMSWYIVPTIIIFVGVVSFGFGLTEMLPRYGYNVGLLPLALAILLGGFASYIYWCDMEHKVRVYISNRKEEK